MSAQLATPLLRSGVVSGDCGSGPVLAVMLAVIGKAPPDPSRLEVVPRTGHPAWSEAGPADNETSKQNSPCGCVALSNQRSHQLPRRGDVDRRATTAALATVNGPTAETAPDHVPAPADPAVDQSAAVARVGRGVDPLDNTPCRNDPVKWDLDAAGRLDGFLDDWRHAIAACGTCPGQRACRALLAEHYPGHGPDAPARNPRGVIWAGRAYGDSGAPLSDKQLAARHKSLCARAAKGAA